MVPRRVNLGSRCIQTHSCICIGHSSFVCGRGHPLRLFCGPHQHASAALPLPPRRANSQPTAASDSVRHVSRRQRRLDDDFLRSPIRLGCEPARFQDGGALCLSRRAAHTDIGSSTMRSRDPERIRPSHCPPPAHRLRSRARATHVRPASIAALVCSILNGEVIVRSTASSAAAICSRVRLSSPSEVEGANPDGKRQFSVVTRPRGVNSPRW